MQITFKASPDLLKIDDIGESIADADESFRRQFTSRVLAAVRNGDIPLRTKTGLKASPDGLEYVKSNARQTAKHKAEARALTPSLMDLEMKFLRMEKDRYIESEAHMQSIARGAKIPTYDAQILDLAHRQECLAEWDRELQRLDEREELDRIHRNQFVQLSEVADWLRDEQGFDVSIVEPGIPRDDALVRTFAKSFDKSINDLPPKLRRLADLYIPGWSELSATDRRARADEADRQWFEVLCNRLEQAGREKDQANAATPARFAARDYQHGYNKVVRERNGEPNLEAKRATVGPSNERCIELARKSELGIEEWIELTRAGIGKHGGFFEVKTDGVSFIEHDPDFIKSAPAEWQIDMLRDNRHEPLRFPCTPARILDFIDSELCTVRGCFSVPDAFRQAVTAIAPTTDTQPQVPAESQEQTGTAHSGAPEVTPAGIPKGQILSVDWPLPPGAPTLQNIIDNLPKWVEESCTKVGRVGKGPDGSHLWNPAILAACLATKTPQKQWAAGKGALTSFLRRSFPDYLKQWEEAAKSL